MDWCIDYKSYRYKGDSYFFSYPLFIYWNINFTEKLIVKYLDITLEIVINSCILAIIGAMIRLLFTKIDTFFDGIRTFVGSILFGITVGYVLNDFAWAKPYIKAIVVIVSIFGKELFKWLEKIIKNPAEHIGPIITFINALKSISIKFGANTKKETKEWLFLTGFYA